MPTATDQSKPTTLFDPSEIFAIVADIPGYCANPKHSLESLLTTLETYECWDPYIDVIETYLQSPALDIATQKEVRVRYAKVLLKYLGRKTETIQTLVELVSGCDVSYKEFARSYLYRLVAKDDYTGEAYLLDHLAFAFNSPGCQVECLERLCFILEKKKFDEKKMHRSFERLLALEPSNKKALLYFKALYSHNGDFQKVAEILTTLLRQQGSTASRYRTAQELASVTLYQLGKPQAAAHILEHHCQGSPLDTQVIRYDCYFQLGIWPKCLQILKNKLRTSTDTKDRAGILFSIGHVQYRARNIVEAKRYFNECYLLDTSQVQAVIKLIEIATELEQPQELMVHLATLFDLTDDPELREEITTTYRRLKQRTAGLLAG